MDDLWIILYYFVSCYYCCSSMFEFQVEKRCLNGGSCEGEGDECR